MFIVHNLEYVGRFSPIFSKHIHTHILRMKVLNRFRRINRPYFFYLLLLYSCKSTHISNCMYVRVYDLSIICKLFISLFTYFKSSYWATLSKLICFSIQNNINIPTHLFVCSYIDTHRGSQEHTQSPSLKHTHTNIYI